MFRSWVLQFHFLALAIPHPLLHYLTFMDQSDLVLVPLNTYTELINPLLCAISSLTPTSLHHTEL